MSRISPDYVDRSAMTLKPAYSVAVAGLDSRDLQLIDMIFRYSQQNRLGFSRIELDGSRWPDVLIANPFDNEGLRAITGARASGRTVRVVTAVPRGQTPPTSDVMAIDRLTLQLLPMLNALFDAETKPSRAVPAPSATPVRLAAPAPTDAPMAVSGSSGSMRRATRSSSSASSPRRPAPAVTWKQGELAQSVMPPSLVQRAMHAVVPVPVSRSASSAIEDAAGEAQAAGFVDSDFLADEFPATQFPPVILAARQPPASIRTTARPGLGLPALRRSREGRQSGSERT